MLIQNQFAVGLIVQIEDKFDVNHKNIGSYLDTEQQPHVYNVSL